jgi:hypothetical protein
MENREAFKVDVDEAPRPTDQVLVGKNPRERSDKPITWIEDEVTTLVFPWSKITFVEVLPNPSDEAEFPLPFRNG